MALAGRLAGRPPAALLLAPEPVLPEGVVEAPRAVCQQLSRVHARDSIVLGAMVIKTSPWSVEETVSRLSAAAVSKGAKVFAVIDHSGEAAAAGLELRDTKVVVFGSPLAGTPVMQAAPLAALDLPLKVLVWDTGEETQVAYASPAELAARYDLDAGLAGRLAGIDVVTDAAIGPADEER
jgi:uncharacterized protein (DUF302 family)